MQSYPTTGEMEALRLTDPIGYRAKLKNLPLVETGISIPATVEVRNSLPIQVEIANPKPLEVELADADTTPRSMRSR